MLRATINSKTPLLRIVTAQQAAPFSGTPLDDVYGIRAA